MMKYMCIGGELDGQIIDVRLKTYGRFLNILKNTFTDKNGVEKDLEEYTLQPFKYQVRCRGLLESKLLVHSSIDPETIAKVTKILTGV